MKIIQWVSTNKPINIFGYECSLDIPEYKQYNIETKKMERTECYECGAWDIKHLILSKKNSKIVHVVCPLWFIVLKDDGSIVLVPDYMPEMLRSYVNEGVTIERH